jgi:CHRD domain-containing protein
MKGRVLVGVLVLGALAVVVAGSAAFAKGGDDGSTFRAVLNGYNEVVGGPGAGSTGSVSTGARGTFVARVRGDHMDFTLTYSGMEGGTVTQAHPHFAQRHVGGGIFGFLCGGPPPKPACPTPRGTVNGTWTAADVIGPADQGVAGATRFAEFVRALRAGAVYVNVHSSSFPEGEIRGQVRGGDDGNNEDDD